LNKLAVLLRLEVSPGKHVDVLLHEFVSDWLMFPNDPTPGKLELADIDPVEPNRGLLPPGVPKALNVSVPALNVRLDETPVKTPVPTANLSNERSLVMSDVTEPPVALMSTADPSIASGGDTYCVVVMAYTLDDNASATAV
jgi:hypothetical protein